MKEFGISIRRQWQQTNEHGHVKVTNITQNPVQQSRVVYGLRHNEVGTGLDLLFQTTQLSVVVAGARLDSASHHKRRLTAERTPCRIDAAVEIGDHPNRANRIQIEDSGRVGIIAHLGRVPCDDDEIV